MRAVLVGNPNVGKSVLFYALTGVYAESGNFPGTTVELLEGEAEGVRVIDAPGVYGLSRFTEEERVTTETLGSADLVIQVADGRHLARDLFLTLQLRELGLPMVLVLNMMDEVRRDGVWLDVDQLRVALPGLTVIPAAARLGEGLDAVRATLRRPPAAGPAPAFWDGLPAEVARLSPVERLLWWEEDDSALAAVGVRPPLGQREVSYTARRQAADRIAQAVFRPPGRTPWSERLGDWLLDPWIGGASLVLVLLVAYEVVGVLIAGTLVGCLEALMTRFWMPAARDMAGLVFVPDSPGFRLLAGHYGLLTMTVTYLLALLLPLIVGFYLLLGVLEDSGYLPRLATLLDRWFLRLGLNGRAVIPLVLGFGCVTMATVTTRVLGSRRERTIATVLLAWTIPCSAQMGVITGLLAGIGWEWAVLYAGIILGLFVAVGTGLDRTLPGTPTPLLLELPPLRWPSLGGVLAKTTTKVRGFLLEAAPLFALGAVGVEALSIGGLLQRLDAALGPAMEWWLSLPPAATSAFLLGFIRRDFGAADLWRLQLMPHQVLVGAVTLTLFVPCIASTLVILRERGAVQGAAIWLGSILVALATGGLLNRLWP